MALRYDNVNHKLSTNDDASTSVATLDLPCPDICVICLDGISRRATTLPCRHDQFDLPCLGTWLANHRSCPLCKGVVQALKIHSGTNAEYEIIQLPSEAPPNPTQERFPRRGRTRQYTRESCQRRDKEEDTTLQRRREVYSKRTFSLYVGSNAISGYRNVTASMFRSDTALIAKARRWIRRELAVFEFLDPSSECFGRSDRRASNAEYLLEYIIAILKAIDVRGSAGQATELLKDFLGRDNAALFLHELENWLRSPFERLSDWDAAVQYNGSWLAA